MEYKITKQNLEIDLREIKHTIATKPTIMAGEYEELILKKKEIIKRLMKGQYPK